MDFFIAHSRANAIINFSHLFDSRSCYK